ncbi:2-phytyl-1,4-beta-naphthoquinone methyltransferase, chloroplastic isoform X1 [Phalaenopsis equestris]|uniref:2-phytyl-1,4-beta-naphthoquinone methyltransferase, chloroplastic isoform X1 n=1 Tax=Phalaenopsis equestris TaxID=78828 RepID=UPI0009E2DECD|nr:2-phytyl-1,4-beta-naphthoquinone methyltransferase, chloroplastic isoform X1 [Phalaenopsis equestris]
MALSAPIAASPHCSLPRRHRLARKTASGAPSTAASSLLALLRFMTMFCRNPNLHQIPTYLNDLLSLGQHRIWKRMCVSWSGAKKGDVVLDLCCGSGDLTFLLSQKVGSSGEVSALDFSWKQLFVASTRRDLLWKACYKNIKWIEDDALCLPFEDSCFDAITVGFGLRNLIDKQRAMQEIFRVLKPGSKVSILDFNKTSSWINQFREWALDNVVVPAASIYGLSDEYKYIKSSVAEYLTGKELEKLAREVGFSDARHYEIAAGLMGNLVATR